jgi:hypothetical protein
MAQLESEVTESSLHKTYQITHSLILRHYATSHNDLGSIPDEVIGFFNRPNPSSCTMVLGSTKRQEESGIKGGRRVRLTTSPPCVSRLSRENVGASTYHNPMGLRGLLEGLHKGHAQI